MKINKNDFFSRESGIRHFVMLGITVLVLIWVYIAIALLSDWNWLTEALLDWEKLGENLIRLSLMVGISAGYGVLLYWGGRSWMGKCLQNLLSSLFGWMPFVRRLLPGYDKTPSGMRRKKRKLKKKLKKIQKGSKDWNRTQVELYELERQMDDARWENEQARKEAELEKRERAREEAKEDEKEIRRRMLLYTDESPLAIEGEYYAEKETERFIDKVFGAIGALLLWVLGIVGNLLAVVGVPVLAPLVIVLLSALVDMLIKGKIWIMAIIAFVLLGFAVLLMIVHPILTCCMKKKD